MPDLTTAALLSIIEPHRVPARRRDPRAHEDPRRPPRRAVYDRLERRRDGDRGRVGDALSLEEIAIGIAVVPGQAPKEVREIAASEIRRMIPTPAPDAQETKP